MDVHVHGQLRGFGELLVADLAATAALLRHDRSSGRQNYVTTFYCFCKDQALEVHKASYACINQVWMK